ncbi:MAG: hypothetical protein HYV27_11050 [Candidatus Hydrogenedentes bacterium]|nr:hypothetical protein [Candidatus Hydrogenedentota bacterium]
MLEFLHEHPYVLALAIFCSRVTDVSIGTMRTILVIRSRRILATILGFFEVTIWMLAARQVIVNLDAWSLVSG